MPVLGLLGLQLCYSGRGEPALKTEPSREGRKCQRTQGGQCKMLTAVGVKDFLEWVKINAVLL